MAEEDKNPRTSPTFPKVIHKLGEGVMNFGDILTLLANVSPAKARRLEWPNDGSFIAVKDEKLVLHDIKDNRLHPLLVTVGDILGKDWVLVHAGDEKKEEGN